MILVTAATGHVGRDRPGQSFHADFYGLLTPPPVQVLMNVVAEAERGVRRRAGSRPLDVAGNRETEHEMLTGVMGTSRC